MARKKNRTLMLGVSIAVLALFGFSIKILISKLSGITINEVIAGFSALHRYQVVLSFIFMILSYSIYTLYDLLAIKYLKYPIKYSKIFVGSFISYVFSENLGFAVLSGSTIRYKYYSEWGIKAKDIAIAITFCTITFWLGLLAVSGFSLVINPINVEPGMNGLISNIFIHTKLIGIIMLSIVFVYFFVGVLKKTPMKIKGSQYIIPSVRLALLQLGIGLLDFTIGSLVFYMLLPASDALSFPMFISIFMFVKVVALFSNVPAGLGVFETFMLIMLSAYYGKGSILVTILIYRIVYYIIPLITALFLYVYTEVKVGHKRFMAFKRLSRLKAFRLKKKINL